MEAKIKARLSDSQLDQHASAAEELMSGFLWVGFGGAVGAMARYGLGLCLPYNISVVYVDDKYRWLGYDWRIMKLVCRSGLVLNWGRLFLMVGVLGGFTTFSAFSWTRCCC